MRKTMLTCAIISLFAVSVSFGSDLVGNAASVDSFDTYRYITRNGREYTALLPKNRHANDYTPVVLSGSPLLCAGRTTEQEHSLVLYADIMCCRHLCGVSLWDPLLVECWD